MESNSFLVQKLMFLYFIWAGKMRESRSYVILHTHTHSHQEMCTNRCTQNTIGISKLSSKRYSSNPQEDLGRKQRRGINREQEKFSLAVLWDVTSSGTKNDPLTGNWSNATFTEQLQYLLYPGASQLEGEKCSGDRNILWALSHTISADPET